MIKLIGGLELLQNFTAYMTGKGFDKVIDKCNKLRFNKRIAEFDNTFESLEPDCGAFQSFLGEKAVQREIFDYVFGELSPCMSEDEFLGNVTLDAIKYVNKVKVNIGHPCVKQKEVFLDYIKSLIGTLKEMRSECLSLADKAQIAILKDSISEPFKTVITAIKELDASSAAITNSYSKYRLNEIATRVKYFTEPKDYSSIHKQLSEKNFCLITGNPGVGKSTLAELLAWSYHYQQYDIFFINNLQEVFKNYKSGEKQVFLYDDFLGTVKLKNIVDNEDNELLRFIKQVISCENTKLILVSRENIFKEGKTKSEALTTRYFDISTYYIDINKYSMEFKADVLYNHLYYSEIPKDYKDHIIENGLYMNIINHENYSPRIIEEMTKKSLIKEGMSCSEFYDVFIRTLNNPMEIWRILFKNLPVFSQNLLIALGVLDGNTTVKGLEIAFNKYNICKCKGINERITRNPFNEALRGLENSFLRIETIENYTVVDYHNPSVHDFIDGYLESSMNEVEVEFVARSAVYFEQCEFISDYVNEDSELELRKILAESTIRTLDEYRYDFYSSDFTKEMYGRDNYIFNVSTGMDIIIGLELNNQEELIVRLFENTLNSLYERTYDFDLLLEVIGKLLGMGYEHILRKDQVKDRIKLIVDMQLDVVSTESFFNFETYVMLMSGYKKDETFEEKQERVIKVYRALIGEDEFRKQHTMNRDKSKIDHVEMVKAFIDLYNLKVEKEKDEIFSDIMDDDDDDYMNSIIDEEHSTVSEDEITVIRKIHERFKSMMK